MSLADEIKERNKPPVYGCAVCRVLDGMKPEDRADLQACLDDESITGTAIASILSEHGWQVNPDGKQVRRHRKVCAS